MIDFRSDFKLSNPISLAVISSFYKAMKGTKLPKVTKLFNEWAENFDQTQGGVLESNHMINHMQKFAEMVKEKTLNPKIFLFCLYSYYSLIGKLILSEVYHSNISGVNDSIRDQVLSSKDLQAELTILDSGEIYKKTLGIDNLNESDLFSWYLMAWDPNIERGLNNLFRKLREFDLKTIIGELRKSRDSFKTLYQAIVPQEIRHDLGEYYTPSWLVELTVKVTGYCGKAKDRVLDPGCGTGPFLLEAIRMYRELNHMKPRDEQLKDILDNIVGIDVNPVAVLTARINYFLAISDLLPLPDSGLKVAIPVHLADSMITPLSIGEFDFIIGNPPWIKWEFLSAEYKQKLNSHILQNYELFNFTGQKARHGFAHDDIAAVFTYVTADKYLKLDGRLGFVLKQTLFTNEANAGFRNFQIKTSDKLIPFGVLMVIDLLEIDPFRPYGAETAIAIFKKGQSVRYPVPYDVWHYRDVKNKTNEKTTLDDFIGLASAENKMAIPDPDEKTDNAPWVFMENMNQLPLSFGEGKNYYKPRHGIVNDLVSVFFVNILKKAEGSKILIENEEFSDKRVQKVKKRTAVVKPDLLYLCVKSRHIKKWKLDLSSRREYLILPQRKAGERSIALEVENRELFEYLSEFRGELTARSSIHFKNKPFYSVYSVGEYTFKPFKIVWKSMVQEPAFVVISSLEDEFIGTKPLMPDNPIGYIAVDDVDEAYYICGILNSNLLRLFFYSKQRGTKYPISQAIIEKVPIQRYDAKNTLHKEISTLSQQIHEQVGQNQTVDEHETQLNIKVEEIFNFDSIM